MTVFYDLLDKIKDKLESNPSVQTVTYGDISEVDLDKQTIFPLAHFMTGGATYEGNTWVFDLSVLCMDIVDESKEEGDSFRGNNNEHDVFNTQLQVINSICDELNRGDLRADNYVLNGNPTVEAFVDRFENRLAGWTLSLQIRVMNTYSLC